MNSNQHRVLIVGDSSLFSSGLETFLSQQSGITVAHSWATTIPDLKTELEGKEPDIVVLHEPPLLQKLISQVEIFERYGGIRIIVVHQQSNALYIYSREQVQVTQANDLITIIQRSREVHQSKGESQ